jgi:predicted DNA-binding antitoxin AbrB/MazE fold protein
VSIVVKAVYEDGVLKPDRPLDLADKTRVNVIIEGESARARTPLGARLRELREEIVASGAPTLDWDELSSEVAARRGGFRESR